MYVCVAQIAERCTNCRNESTAGRPVASLRMTPFPTRITGRFAASMMSRARSITLSSARGYVVRRISSGLASTLSAAMSSGSSMCAAPGFSSRARRNALRTTSGTVFATVTRLDHFVTGVNMPTMSMY